MKQLLLLGIFNLLLGKISAQVNTYREDINNFRSQNWIGLIKDPRTTLVAGDSIYLAYFPIKEKNKVYCKVELLDGQESFDMPTYSGQLKSFRKYARLAFVWRGKNLHLFAYQSFQLITNPVYKDYLFIPFKDLTSGKQTYSGGRYIDIKMGQIQNGTMILDLNQVYNPWCAYSDGYNCPIPPSENNLLVKLKCGEKMFRKKH